MKNIIILAIISAIITGCSKENEEKIIRKDIVIAHEYLKDCKENKAIIPIGKIKDVEKYWETVPELKKVRQQFLAANEDLGKELSKDEEHRTLMKEVNKEVNKEKDVNLYKAGKIYSSKKNKIYARLHKESKEYRDAREKRQEALRQCNIATFEYIINEYESNGEPFPIEWVITIK